VNEAQGDSPEVASHRSGRPGRACRLVNDLVQCADVTWRQYGCSFILPLLADVCSDAADGTSLMAAGAARYTSGESPGSDAIVVSS